MLNHVIIFLAYQEDVLTLVFMSELGRYPLYFSIIINLVKYWIRLEKSDNTFLKESCRRINIKMVVQVGLVVYTICFNFWISLLIIFYRERLMLKNF